MIAYIICVNDGIEAVVLNDKEKATIKMEELSNKYYERHYWNFKSKK